VKRITVTVDQVRDWVIQNKVKTMKEYYKLFDQGIVPQEFPKYPHQTFKVTWSEIVGKQTKRDIVKKLTDNKTYFVILKEKDSSSPEYIYMVTSLPLKSIVSKFKSNYKLAIFEGEKTKINNVLFTIKKMSNSFYDNCFTTDNIQQLLFEINFIMDRVKIK
jgi:uncharacterized protein YjaZ